jgi:hypothetical protein
MRQHRRRPIGCCCPRATAGSPLSSFIERTISSLPSSSVYRLLLGQIPAKIGLLLVSFFPPSLHLPVRFGLLVSIFGADLHFYSFERMPDRCP